MMKVNRTAGSRSLHRMVRRFVIVPVTFAEANAFVARHHRHHKPTPGVKFCVGTAEGEEMIGVAMVGRPVARILDNGWTLEVNRCCTDGSPNVCSALYGAAWRVARELGYHRLITYTLPSEGGASLRGAGWKLLGERGGGTWNRKERPRVDTHPMELKFCWERAHTPNENKISHRWRERAWWRELRFES